MNYDLTNPETVVFGQKLGDVEKRRANLSELVKELVTRNRTPSSTYKEINFEQLAYRENGKSNKKLLTYDQSLARLRSAGFERHARPQEAFSLIIDGLEGKLDAATTPVSENMLASYGEWLSLAFERQGDRLTCYVDPAGLVWNGNDYAKTSDFTFSSKEEFNISGVPSNDFVELSKFPEGLVRFIYGKPVAELPEKMRVSNARAGGYFPSSGKVRPVGRGNYYDWFIVDGYVDWASRGVRRAKNFP